MADDNKYIQKLLSMGRHYDLDKKSHININETCSAFEGFPKQRTGDSTVLLLFPNAFPNSHNEGFHEFALDSIMKIDDLGQVANASGETVNKIRVWIKKGSAAILSQYFTVK